LAGSGFGKAETVITAFRFTNRRAIVLWVFAAAWLSVLAMVTYAWHRDGGPEGYSGGLVLAVLAFFWLGGVALLAYALSTPCFLVEVDAHGRAHATWRYPFHRARRVIGKAELSPARIVVDEDGDGAPYYIARVKVRNAEPLALVESQDRSICEQACARFNAAVGFDTAESGLGP
jgi:hypothetical protein